MAPTDDDDPIGYLSPVLAELAVEYRRRGDLGVPRLSLALRTRLLDAPPSVSRWLTTFVDAAPTPGISDNRDVAQAVQLLGALHTTAALPKLFRLATRLAEDPSADLDQTSLVFSALWRAFDDLRDHLVDPFLAFVGAESPQAIGRLLVLVAEAGISDERVFQVLVASLERHPDDAATALLVYGDARAVTTLRSRLAALAADSRTITWCRAVACLTHAIEELGGALDAGELRLAHAATALERAIGAVAARQVRDAEDAAALALVTHPDEMVRAWIATHAWIEPRYVAARLSWLARDQAVSVRLAVARARAVPGDVLDALIGDQDPAVAEVARARHADDAALEIETRAAIPVAIDRSGETTDPIPSAALLRLRVGPAGERA